MPDNDAPLNLEATLGIKVIRKDGTVEDLGQQDVPDEEKERMKKSPSLKEWLKRRKREG